MTTSQDPIRIGVAGLGRSGWNIHVRSLKAMPQWYRIAAVMEVDAARRAQAHDEVGCRGYETFEQLIGDEQLEVIVVASPNRFHTDHAIAAMRAGKHVVCEKPMALSVGDADRMLAAADETGRLLAPFQNRRYEGDFQKVKEVIDSGLLGEVVLIRLAQHGFSRRWDWQTLKEFGGGSLNNNGPHVIDQALQLLGPGEPDIFVDLRNGLSSGDAEDHVKLVLKADGPTVDVELTALAAFPQDRWLVMGTAGALRGTPKKLEWKWVDWQTMPPRPVDRTPMTDRSYNREEITWQTDSWEPPAKANIMVAFYEGLYESVRRGKPLFITPESVRRQIALLDRCHAACEV